MINHCPVRDKNTQSYLLGAQPVSAMMCTYMVFVHLLLETPSYIESNRIGLTHSDTLIHLHCVITSPDHQTHTPNEIYRDYEYILWPVCYPEQGTSNDYIRLLYSPVISMFS